MLKIERDLELRILRLCGSDVELRGCAVDAIIGATEHLRRAHMYGEIRSAARLVNRFADMAHNAHRLVVAAVVVISDRINELTVGY